MAAPDLEVEHQVRNAAFTFLGNLAKSEGTPLVRQSDLAAFRFQGQPFRLMASYTGIWKPRQLEAALSFRTVFAADPARRPYDDEEGPDGYLRYKWQLSKTANVRHVDLSDNRALRAAMTLALPLIWFRGVASGTYLPIYPVTLAAEEPEHQQFVVALDDQSLRLREELEEGDPELVRRYAERVVRERLHQPMFRERVLVAYEGRCSICRLSHLRLLDAAHVLADADGGEPVVTNGIAMCKIHHAAYDADIFGISPDYEVGVRPDVMEEIDGPTLKHTLQAINGASMNLPRQKAARPNRELLTARWQRFKDAS